VTGARDRDRGRDPSQGPSNFARTARSAISGAIPLFKTQKGGNWGNFGAEFGLRGREKGLRPP